MNSSLWCFFWMVAITTKNKKEEERKEGEGEEKGKGKGKERKKKKKRKRKKRSLEEGNNSRSVKLHDTIVMSSQVTQASSSNLLGSVGWEVREV